MPELPDVDVYVECLRARVVDRRLDRVRISSPFVLRSVTPPIDVVQGRVDVYAGWANASSFRSPAIST